MTSVILIVTILYYLTPNARQEHFRLLGAGAAAAVIVLVGVSLLFALYVKNFADFDQTYRSFAGVIIVLLWLWISNLTLLFGAEFDVQFERARQLESGIEAEETIQLPARDTQVMEKNERRQKRAVDDGRRIRQASGKGRR